MRQIGEEFKVDPHKPIGAEAVPEPQLPESFKKDHLRWLTNLVTMRQHKYCSALCINFTSSTNLGDMEKTCMQNCFTKYNQALESYAIERSFFQEGLEDLKAQGKDHYASRNI